MLLKMTCLWHPSAWLSARLWLARAKLSLSPSLLAPPSPSPWTPRRQHLCQRRRRSPVLQLWDEMLPEERSSWKGRLNLLQWWKLQIQSNAHLSSPTHLCHFLQWKLSWSPPSVTIVMRSLTPTTNGASIAQECTPTRSECWRELHNENLHYLWEEKQHNTVD